MNEEKKLNLIKNEYKKWDRSTPSRKPRTKERDAWVFILELHSGKYYLGVSYGRNAPNEAIRKHFSGRGTEWTLTYPPIAIKETIFSDSILNAKKIELEKTLTYIKDYGWENVRGSIEERNIRLDPKREKEVWVYVLELTSQKYYVGFTSGKNSPDRRIEKHFSGKGSKWTKTNPPRIVKETLKANCKENGLILEMETTLKYMKKYGWENVRGSIWVWAHEIDSHNKSFKALTKYLQLSESNQDAIDLYNSFMGTALSDIHKNTAEK